MGLVDSSSMHRLKSDSYNNTTNNNIIRSFQGDNCCFDLCRVVVVAVLVGYNYSICMYAERVSV